MDACEKQGRLRLGLSALAFAAVLAPWAPNRASADVPSPPATHKSFGKYTVYYSAVRTEALPRSVLRQHDLPAPSPDEILLNVSVKLKGRSVAADVHATAVNLAQEQRDIPMRPAQSGAMFAYIGTLHLPDEQEVLTFRIDVQPQGSRKPFEVSFRRSFVPVPAAQSGAGRHGVPGLEAQ